MAALYFWTTGIVVVLSILTTSFGWMVLPVGIALPLFIGPLLAIMSFLPTAAIALVCGVPAVLARRNPIIAIAALALGSWIFAQFTILVPQKSKDAVQAVAAAVETAPSLPKGEIGHVALYNGGNYHDFSCRNLCQRLLIDANAKTISIRSNSNAKEAITFRKGYGDECAFPAATGAPCVLLTRNRDQAADVSIRNMSGSEIFGGSVASLTGISNAKSWIITTSKGLKIPADPGYLRPATGWQLEPAWMQGGLDQIDRRGLVRARTTAGAKPEHLKPFLRRAGLNLGDRAKRRPIPLRMTLTPAAVDDALSGPLQGRLRKMLERKKG